MPDEVSLQPSNDVRDVLPIDPDFTLWGAESGGYAYIFGWGLLGWCNRDDEFHRGKVLSELLNGFNRCHVFLTWCPRRN